MGFLRPFLVAMSCALPLAAASAQEGIAQDAFVMMPFDPKATAMLERGQMPTGNQPYLIVGTSVYLVPQACWPRKFGGDDEGRRFGGDDEGRRFGGGDEGRRFGGGDEGRRFGGGDEGRRFGGDDEGRRFGGDDEGRRFGGDDEGRRFGGDDEGRRFGGGDEGRRFGGDDQGRRFGGDDEGRRFGGGDDGPRCQLSANRSVLVFEPFTDGEIRSGGTRYRIVAGRLQF